MSHCSDALKRHYNLGQFWLEVDIEDVASFDETLAGKLNKLPTETLPLVRPAAADHTHTHTHTHTHRVEVNSGFGEDDAITGVAWQILVQVSVGLGLGLLSVHTHAHTHTHTHTFLNMDYKCDNLSRLFNNSNIVNANGCDALQFEEAAKEVADEVTRPRPEGDEEVQDIQVMLNSKRNPSALRDLKVRCSSCTPGFVLVLLD